MGKKESQKEKRERRGTVRKRRGREKSGGEEELTRFLDRSLSPLSTEEVPNNLPHLTTNRREQHMSYMPLLRDNPPFYPQSLGRDC